MDIYSPASRRHDALFVTGGFKKGAANFSSTDRFVDILDDQKAYRSLRRFQLHSNAVKNEGPPVFRQRIASAIVDYPDRQQYHGAVQIERILVERKSEGIHYLHWETFLKRLWRSSQTKL